MFFLWNLETSIKLTGKGCRKSEDINYFQISHFLEIDNEKVTFSRNWSVDIIPIVSLDGLPPAIQPRILLNLIIAGKRHKIYIRSKWRRSPGGWRREILGR